MRKEVCIYCGNNQKLTRDHMPPKQLFPKPWSNSMLTVPSCFSCNNKSSKDDQYFKDCLVLGSHGSANVKSVLQKTSDGLRRTEAKGYRAGFYSNIFLTENEDLPAGIEINLPRFNRVLHRIVKGLYYNEKGVPLSKNAEIRVFQPRQVTIDSNEDQDFRKLFEYASFLDTGSKEIFKYKVIEMRENSSEYYVWKFVFYESIEFIGSVIVLSGNK